MAQVKDSSARNGRLMMVRRSPRRGGAVIIVGSILVGLVIARFMMISPIAAVFALSSGIVFAVTVLLRKTDYLIFAWFVLTSFVFLIMGRLAPQYYEFVGRGVFWGLLACVVVAWAMDNILSGRQFVLLDNVPLKVGILIFVLWCIATLFTSIDVLNSIKKLSHIIIALVVFYMFYDFFSRDQDNIRKVLGVLLFVVTSISVIAIGVAADSLISGVTVYKKISLWFVNPNVLGHVLYPCIPILITAGLYFLSNRFLKILLVFILLFALFLSFHRTSWLAALVSIFFLLCKGRMKIPIWTMVVVSLFLAALLFPVVGLDTYDYVTGERYTGRIEIWQAAWKTASDYPPFGTGPGNVRKVLPQYIDTPWLQSQDTHSLYLKNASEMGFMAVVIWLVVYFTFLFSSERIEKNLKSNYLRLVTRGVTATFLGVFVHGIFENGYFLTSFVGAEFHVMIPYMLMALPFACKKLEERQGLAA
jgi:O-antigen ligase